MNLDDAAAGVEPPSRPPRGSMARTRIPRMAAFSREKQDARRAPVQQTPVHNFDDERFIEEVHFSTTARSPTLSVRAPGVPRHGASRCPRLARVAASRFAGMTWVPDHLGLAGGWSGSA